MLKILLPVDGSPSAVRATETLIETIGWYREAPSIELVSVHLLDAAGVPYTSHALTGPIAETIVHQAKESGSNMLYMGTRGMSALANMALGSVTTRVLHLCHIPVVLIH